MNSTFKEYLQNELTLIKGSGLYKKERIITSPQNSLIIVKDENPALNFCANNYLGLSSHPRVIKAAQKVLSTHGYGMSSVRFICGTQDIHKELEYEISKFLSMEDTILYAACFDANGGVFEPLLGANDAIISDELNHASIIDGVRLCKAARYRYRHSDMQHLEDQLKDAQKHRFRIVVTDGVFSMDGDIAQLNTICDLADRYNALVMVDDSHAVGFIGKTGKGSHEYHNVMNRVDIITGTLGKALGGALGGYTAGKKEIIDILRQRSRPYLFSNSLAPSIVGASLEVFNILNESTNLRDKVIENATYFKSKIKAAGFDIKPTESAIIALMLYDAKIAQKFASLLLKEGIYVIGFYYPVVPKGQARIRIQVSAAHSKEQLDTAIKAFTKIGKELKVIH